MATYRTVSYVYRHPVAAVMELLFDADYLRGRAEALGDGGIEVAVAPNPDGTVEVEVARQRETQLPAFAQKMFDSTNRVVERTFWKRVGDGWAGEYTVQIEGAPAEIKGESRLVPTNDGGCAYESSFELVAYVPLLAKKLEGFVAERIESGIRLGAELNDRRLSGPQVSEPGARSVASR